MTYFVSKEWKSIDCLRISTKSQVFLQRVVKYCQMPLCVKLSQSINSPNRTLKSTDFQNNRRK